ncbi:hypothetical protein [Paracoccus tibetensis]|uniref:Uncharacterized protein n=1 Tax=Paracoccus tibetensis TaxID=336292 RepID=A0A1G5BF62_9RHOB|nr:hypothetical protein [Paracoccus tibetensis]SCX88769.1 hypothetical protein SAMN05660710_00119 [Paracoccus tibetensis]
MQVFDYLVIRKSDGAEIVSASIVDAMDAGLEPMKLAVAAALLHSHPMAKGLKLSDLEIHMAPQHLP